MKAAVLGVGRMGTAIAWAMDKLGFEVLGMDTDPEAKKNMPESQSFLTVGDTNDIFTGLVQSKRPDVVISSLPYHQTKEVGLWCIDNEVRYCDLGGKVSVSQAINEYATEKASKPVMTDLGLAPGWVNILAEKGCRELYGVADEISVEMMVGGLPDWAHSNENPLRYAITWSVDGLINEYKDDCIILQDGEIKTVEGMSGLEPVDTDISERLECFYTSGGASHSIYSMKDRGVKNCSYKTLRYPGHRDIVRFLIRDCNLSHEVLEKIFIEGCGFAREDVVIILARVFKDNKVWKEEKIIKSDDSFTAMQKATAFPISSVASLMAEGYFDGEKSQCRGYWECFNKSLSYSDVPFDKFNEKMELLNG